MNMGKRGEISPSSNIHFKTAYLDWREGCSTDLGVRFRETYPCDMTDCYNGSVGRIIKELARLIKLFRTSGWPFRRALSRYFTAVHCIRRVSLAYFEKSRALQASYMEWWINAEKQWKIEDEQKRLERKVPTNGAAAERYHKLSENISMNIKDDVRKEALVIHLRKLKFAFMKKYSVWLKQYKVYNTEMKRRRREAMLLRHSKIAQDNPDQHSRIDSRLREYRREFIKHILAKPSIKLNPKAEKLELMYESVDQVEEERVKKREMQLMAQYEKEKRERLRSASRQQKKLIKNKQSSSASPGALDPDNLVLQRDESGMVSSPSNSSPSPHATIVSPSQQQNQQQSSNQNIYSASSFCRRNFDEEKTKYQDQVIDIYAKAPPSRPPMYGQDHSLKTLHITSLELQETLGSMVLMTSMNAAAQDTTSLNNILMANSSSMMRLDSSQAMKSSFDASNHNQHHHQSSSFRRKDMSTSSISGTRVDDRDDFHHEDGDFIPTSTMNGALPPPVSNSAREEFLQKLSRSGPAPQKISPFQAFGARAAEAKKNIAVHHQQANKDDSKNDGDEQPKHNEQKNNNNSKIDDSAYDANVNRLYFPNACPFRILDDKGLSEIDVECRRVQKDALRRATLNMKHLQQEEEMKHKKRIDDSKERLLRAKVGAGLSEKTIRTNGGLLSNNNNSVTNHPLATSSSSPSPQPQQQRQRQTSFLDSSDGGQNKNDNKTLPSEISVKMIQNKLKEREIKNRKLLKSLSPSRDRKNENSVSPSDDYSTQRHFNFSPFSRSRFSAKKNNKVLEDDDDEDEQQRKPSSSLTLEMLRNAVHTGSSWTPSRVIVQRSNDGKTLIPSPGAVQQTHPELPSTKGFSKNVVDPSSSVGRNNNNTNNNNSIFNYIFATGDAALNVSEEEIRMQNRMKARQLRPLLESRIGASSSSSPSSSQHQHHHSTPSRGTLHQYHASTPSPQKIITSIETLLRTPPPPPAAHRNENRLNQVRSIQNNVSLSPSPQRSSNLVGATRLQREFDVCSMARSPPPYVNQ